MAGLLEIEGARKYVITVECLTGGRATVLSAEEALQHLMASLGEHVERAGLRPVRRGSIIANRYHAEAGLFLDRSFTEGAQVGARCETVARQVEFSVARSSPAMRLAIYTSLALGLLAGLVFGYQLSRRHALLIGLAVGLVLTFLLIMIAVRIDALAGGRSAALADKLDAAVRDWLARPERAPGVASVADERTDALTGRRRGA